MATNTPVPSTKDLKTLQRDLQKNGTVWRCIQGGFIGGIISNEQATDLQNQLANVVDYCQQQQEIIFQLQSQLAQTKQTQLFS